MTNTELGQWIKALISHHNIKAFYNSALWEHLRHEVLDEQHHECQLCKAKGLAEPASTVHHIRYVRQYPQLALTKSNLIVVCEECHYQIHHGHKPKPQLNEERW